MESSWRHGSVSNRDQKLSHVLRLNIRSQSNVVMETDGRHGAFLGVATTLDSVTGKV